MKQMNAKIIAIVVALVILLAAGGYFLLGKNSTPPTQNPTSEQTTKQPNSMSQSLFDLLSAGKTQKCTFTSTTESGKTEGTVYLTGDQMRGDISTTSKKDNKTTVFYMIRNGDTTYIWGDALPSGIKMTVSAQDLQSNPQTSQYINPSQKADYSCGAWVVDNSMFKVPTNIKFTDVSAMMPHETGTTNTNNKGYLCDGLTGQAKTACEQSMQK